MIKDQIYEYIINHPTIKDSIKRMNNNDRLQASLAIPSFINKKQYASYCYNSWTIDGTFYLLSNEIIVVIDKYNIVKIKEFMRLNKIKNILNETI